MPVEIIDIRKDIPKPKRKRKSVIESTKEWQYVQTKLSNGLKPHEGLRIVLTNETMRKVKHAPRMLQKRIERYLEELKLDYDVFRRGSTEEGTPILYVAGRDGRLS